MPKVLSHTPPWLSRPSPGASLFTSTSLQAPLSNSENGADKNESYEGPHRTLACRGLEVFAVVGNQIRWSDLTTLQSQWPAHSSLKSSKAGINSHNNTIQKTKGANNRAPYKVGQNRVLFMIQSNGHF